MENKTDKFADEQDLLDAYVKGDFTAEECVESLVPEEVRSHYGEFCSQRNLQKSEASAASFLNWWYGEDSDREPTEEELLDEENPSSETTPSESADTFKDWDGLKVTQLSTSDNAANVIMWRWKNPLQTDKQECATATNVPIAEVEKWWNAVDWINGYVGGHFHPQNMTKKELKYFLIDACTKSIEA